MIPRTPTHRPATRRTGATLTEVLMALLIMGIGVTSVITLFPISILRAIQATNQTNARILKLAIEEDTYSRPALFNQHQPPASLTPGVSSRFRGEWRPGATYFVGDIVYPPVQPGAVQPEPNLWYFCTATEDGNGATIASARSGQRPPDWPTNGTVTDASTQTLGPPAVFEVVFWEQQPLMHLRSADQRPHDDPAGVLPLPRFSTRQYVVDPLGWAVAQAEGTTVFQAPFEFGNKTDDLNVVATSPPATMMDPEHLLRINGGLNTQAAAVFGTSLPDSWETLVEATPIAFAPVPTGPQPVTTSVTFPPTVNLNAVDQIYADLGSQLATSIVNVPPRIVLTSADGTQSQTRFLDPRAGTPGNTVSWLASNPLPTSFVARDIGQVRIETFDRRYTWLMTVKKDDQGNTRTQVVIVFNRRFQPHEEHMFDANFGNPDVDIDPDGTADGPQHGLAGRSDWVKIVRRAGEPEMFLEPGNFIFDARAVEWYRIREIFDEDPGATPPFAVLILDRTVTPPTAGDGTGPPDGPDPGPGRAILMRGIVDVFDL